MPDDVTISGWILRETPSGMAWVFMADDRPLSIDQVILPKSLVAVVKGTELEMDRVTLPHWLAIEKNLI